MSHSGKPMSEVGLGAVADRFRETLNCDNNKPDFKELDLGSPVSPLRTRRSGPAGSGVTTTSSSSSSSGSVRFRWRPPVNLFRRWLREFSVRQRFPDGQHLSIWEDFENWHGQSELEKRRFGVRNGQLWPRQHNAGRRRPKIRRSWQVKQAGNDQYKRGHFREALSFYDRAIALSPGNAAYHSNRAAALTGLHRLPEAVRECEEAVRLDPGSGIGFSLLLEVFCFLALKSKKKLDTPCFSLLDFPTFLDKIIAMLGQVENARRHLFVPGQQPDPAELQKLLEVEKHLSKCSDARRIGDWRSALREGDAAIAAGADSSPQIFTCRVEAHLKLHQLDDAESNLSYIPKSEPSGQSSSQAKFFGMLSEAYLHFVQAQIEMALGRFENAVTAVEKAGQIDPRNVEVAVLLNNVRMVARARARGNDLFKSERFTEACAAYGEGLRLDPSNSVLYCNRAACYYKLGMWERSVDDCNQALYIQPNYMKALLRRAASYSKLERWVDAVRDYELLRRELPNDNDVAESLFHAQVALKKSRGEEVYNMKFGGEVEDVSSLEQFKSAISSPGVSIVLFKAATNPQSEQISPFVDTLCGRYPSLSFLKVDVEQSPAIASVENVRILPTFKIYKNGSRVKEIICPTREVLESSVRHYGF
ncbi:unnamed protein product, partial [Vitis vinifera]